MSLTREEWETMWADIRAIEEAMTRASLPKATRLHVQMRIQSIKDAIQAVIGQLE